MLNTNYTKVVAAVKDIARDNLRMGLISKRQTKINTLNAKIADFNADIDAENKIIAQANYDLSIVDDKNPSAADIKTELKDSIKDANEVIKSIKEAIEDVKKEIAEQEAGIKKIESGETKVSLDELNALTDVLMLSITKDVAVVAAKDAAAAVKLAA